MKTQKTVENRRITASFSKGSQSRVNRPNYLRKHWIFILSITLIIIAGTACLIATVPQLQLWHDLLRFQRLPQSIADWSQFDGIWDGRNGTFSDLKGGGGDKALAGSTKWSDYTLDADIRFDSDRDARWGDAGVIVRASDATIGTDAYNGYYAGIRLRDHALVLSRSKNEFVQLATNPLPQPVAIGRWYHLAVTVKDCSIKASVGLDGESGTPTSIDYFDRDCPFRQGQIGLRTYNMQTSWRNLRVTVGR